MYFRTDN